MRQSRRKQKPGYQGGLKADTKIVHVEFKQKSRAGVEHTKVKRGIMKK